MPLCRRARGFLGHTLGMGLSSPLSKRLVEGGVEVMEQINITKLDRQVTSLLCGGPCSEG